MTEFLEIFVDSTIEFLYSKSIWMCENSDGHHFLLGKDLL